MIQNKEDYIQEALRLLSDSHTYKTILNKPLQGFLKEATQLINRALHESIISKTEASFLKRDFYKIPYFYHLPKVHKDLDNPPGHPIVAAKDSVTSCFSKYVDSFLQPLA